MGVSIEKAANYNHENLLIAHDSETVLAYCLQFEKLWEELEEYAG